MDFDSTIKKAKEVFGTAYQKSGDIVNIERLRIEIATLTVKRDKDYKELGRLRYNALKGAIVSESAEQQLITAIEQKTTRIERYKELIKLFKNKNTTTDNVNFDAIFKK